MKKIKDFLKENKRDIVEICYICAVGYTWYKLGYKDGIASHK